MTVYAFGNQELPMDSLPVRILERLRLAYPSASFVHKDPNESWELEPDAVILDTVVGLAEPAIFRDLAAFERAPRLTVHDFDLYAELRLRQKIGRLPNLTIIGLPPQITDEDAVKAVGRLLDTLTD